MKHRSKDGNTEIKTETQKQRHKHRNKDKHTKLPARHRTEGKECGPENALQPLRRGGEKAEEPRSTVEQPR